MRPDIKQKLELHRQWLKYNAVESDPDSEEDISTLPRGEPASFKNESLKGLRFVDEDMSGVDLSDADMSNVKFNRSKLRGAKFGGARMRGADLSGTNMIEADLVGADLTGASIRWCNLQFAKLTDADLTDLDLCYAIGDGQRIKLINPYAPWWIVYTATHMAIGCEQHSLADWEAFPLSRFAEMDGLAPAIWEVKKPALFAAIAAFPAEEFIAP